VLNAGLSREGTRANAGAKERTEREERKGLAEAWEAHQAGGESLADLILRRGVMTREGLLRRVAAGLGARFARVGQSGFRPEWLGELSPELARRYEVVPCGVEAGLIAVLAVDPFNTQALEELAFAQGKAVRLVVADPDEVHDLLRRHYGEGASGLEELLAQMEAEVGEGDAAAGAGTGADGAVAGAELSERDLEALAGQAPVVHFVNGVLAQAIREKASDIHFEPFEHEYRIRYRVDGALYDVVPPPKRLALPIASRLKVMAHLNIAERRVAQDGRISFVLPGQGSGASTGATAGASASGTASASVDLRVSTLPTQFGESIVLRVLDRAAVQLDLAQLGLPAAVSAELGDVIRRPNGIVIVTGPTGAGKTTTLYAALRAVNTDGAKLLTIEDPVEYEIEGIMQVPINAPIGLNFASALRAFLRQDPDVIMVGEIRDLETAQVAIQASLTGHLVLTTLHTNDAAGAVTRLIDMGVEPFLISSTVSAVLAQRLVRRICPQCKTAYQPSADLLAREGIDARRVGGRPFYRGAGCTHCHNTGYRGRLGIFEWLPMTEPIREQVMQRAPTLELRKTAVAQGMRTLREDGLQAVLDGHTTLDELLRYT